MNNAICIQHPSMHLGNLLCHEVWDNHVPKVDAVHANISAKVAGGNATLCKQRTKGNKRPAFAPYCLLGSAFRKNK
jgi:hypothetical protein